MTCPVCHNAHSDECSTASLKARIDSEAEMVAKLTGDVATMEESCALLYADREALWKVVRDSCAVLRVTDDDEADWPKLPGAVLQLTDERDALRAQLAEAEATLANERGEGEPPEEGWRWTGSGWRIESDGRVLETDIIGIWHGTGGFTRRIEILDGGCTTPGRYDTHRSAMREATKLMRGGA